MISVKNGDGRVIGLYHCFFSLLGAFGWALLDGAVLLRVVAFGAWPRRPASEGAELSWASSVDTVMFESC